MKLRVCTFLRYQYNLKYVTSFWLQAVLFIIEDKLNNIFVLAQSKKILKTRTDINNPLININNVLMLIVFRIYIYIY